MRIGHGYDAHRFAEGHRLVIGGVEIPHNKGLLAHSDGDVLLHAVCDALLGAAGLGDIGRHFPDSSQEYENIDSRILLRHVIDLLIQRQYSVVNIDATIVAQEPKLAGYIASMRQTMSADIGFEPECINIKATTTEGMGFTGRSEGIAAHAVVLLQAAPTSLSRTGS
ncbi:MAG: 2-C-methyl-D-erythritol 2,4-cyclodiphosphate synthase [Gammaproteobacteria bacterium]|nr:2-C-methyl-D-erythritol 2,4-cyclodiphosphate synthase [Gammaproteobacteria bacterium]